MKTNNFLALFVAVYVSISIIPKAAIADSVDPFNIKNSNNPYSIDKLTCRDFAHLIASKDPQSFVVIVWAHGVASGFNNSPIKFDNNSFVGTLTAISYYCQNHETDTIFQSISALKNNLK